MAFILAGVITFQSFHISPGDITGLDELLEHYRYHQKQYGDDLITFITKHYGEDGNGMDHQDEEHHQSLPFQHASSLSHGPLAVVQPAEYLFSIPEVTVTEKDNFYASLYNTLFVTKTFQPPKRS